MSTKNVFLIANELKHTNFGLLGFLWNPKEDLRALDLGKQRLPEK